jgi:hypothetical protein
MAGTSKVGISQDKEAGILQVTESGKALTTPAINAAPRADVTIQPYQYMAGPSSGVEGVQPQAKRLLAG